MSTTLTRRTIIVGTAIASASAASVPAVMPDLAEAAGRDPIFAVIEKCRQMELACLEASNAQTDWNDDIDAEASAALEARMMLATTIPTSWAGVTALIVFVAEWSILNDGFYFEHDEAVPYAVTLAQAVKQLTAKVPR